jgi:hypothetical protein
MKLHHAAALACSIALMGWFLMVPPLVRHGSMTFDDAAPAPTADLEAPLNKWSKAESFDSSDACEDRLKAMKSPFPPGTPSVVDNYQCVYEGDPRLAK